MSVTDSVRSWADLFAARTRADVGEGLAEILALAGNTDLISFAGGFPDPRTFPGAVAAELMRELVEAGDSSALQYAPTRGLPGTLEALTARLETTQGHRPDPSELMITSGAIEALELVGKSFIDPGDVVIVEGPTYLGAIMAFRSFGADVVAIPMDEDGLSVEDLERRLDEGLKPKLVYTIPDHQNPAGVSLSSERRSELVAAARTHGFLVIEDVAYRELGFGDETLQSLWSLAPDVVLQVGTTSKTFFPGVRLGWGAGPSEIVSQLVAAKQNTDQCAGALGQRLFEEYARRGLMDEQLRQSRALYGRRCELMMAALDASMPAEASWTRPRGGFFTWLTLPDGSDSVDFVKRAVGEGVAVVPGVPFYPDGRGTTNVRLSFSRVENELIPEGVERLAKLIRSGLEGRTT